VVGAEALNRSAQDVFGRDGIGELTDFTQVHRAVYEPVDGQAGRLTNRQLVEVAAGRRGRSGRRRCRVL
jgi:hypothetical protein